MSEEKGKDWQLLSTRSSDQDTFLVFLVVLIFSLPFRFFTNTSIPPYYESINHGLTNRRLYKVKRRLHITRIFGNGQRKATTTVL